MWVLRAMHSVISCLYVVCPALNVLPSWSFAGYFLNSYVVCPAVNVFAPFVGFADYIWFSILFARLPIVSPLFVWALRAVLFSYVSLPCCYRFALCVYLPGCNFVWLLFALLLNVSPLLMWALRVILISYVVLFAVNILAAFFPFSYRLCRPFYFYFLNSYVYSLAVSVLALRAILF